MRNKKVLVFLLLLVLAQLASLCSSVQACHQDYDHYHIKKIGERTEGSHLIVKYEYEWWKACSTTANRKWTTEHDITDLEKKKKDAEKDYGVTQVGPADPKDLPKYDCHGYTFADRKHWIDNSQVEDILKAKGLTSKGKGPAKVCDKVIYKKSGAITHSGHVTKVDDKGNVLEVQSKWGSLGEYKHGPDKVPGSYGDWEVYDPPNQSSFEVNWTPDVTTFTDSSFSIEHTVYEPAISGVADLTSWLENKTNTLEVYISSGNNVARDVISSLSAVIELINIGNEAAEILMYKFENKTLANKDVALSAYAYVIENLSYTPAISKLKAFLSGWLTNTEWRTDTFWSPHFVTHTLKVLTNQANINSLYYYYCLQSMWETIEEDVGGVWVPVDKLGLLSPYIALASTIVVATAATAIYVKHVKRRKKKH